MDTGRGMVAPRNAGMGWLRGRLTDGRSGGWLATEHGEVVTEVRGEVRSHVRVVLKWINLSDCESVAVRRELPDSFECLRRSETARLMGTRAGCIGGVDRVDVETEEHVVGAADPLQDATDGLVGAYAMKLRCGDLRRTFPSQELPRGGEVEMAQPHLDASRVMDPL